MNKKKPTELQALQDQWYKKLKESGFTDIEHKDGSINRAFSRSDNWKDESLRQLTIDYYCMCTHFLNENKFKDEVERVIWEYHTEGLSIRDTVKLLSQTLNIKRTRVQVWTTVNTLQKLMKGLYLSV